MVGDLPRGIRRAPSSAGRWPTSGGTARGRWPGRSALYVSRHLDADDWTLNGCNAADDYSISRALCDTLSLIEGQKVVTARDESPRSARRATTWPLRRRRRAPPCEELLERRVHLEFVLGLLREQRVHQRPAQHRRHLRLEFVQLRLREPAHLPELGHVVRQLVLRVELGRGLELPVRRSNLALAGPEQSASVRGAYSLSATFSTASTIYVSLCAGGVGANIAGKSFHARVCFDTAGTTFVNQMFEDNQIYASAYANGDVNSPQTTITHVFFDPAPGDPSGLPNSWVSLGGTIPKDSVTTQAAFIGISVLLDDPPSNYSAGTLYIDDVRIF
jgi:hypothetical protein